MKNFSTSNEWAMLFYPEAEALGIPTKVHFCECVARECTCPTQKDVYLTYDKAAKALRMRLNRERTKSIYKCHICGHFHLTSKDGVGRRPKAYSRSREKDFTQHALMMLKDGHIMQVARGMSKMKKSYIVSMNRDLQIAS